MRIRRREDVRAAYLCIVDIMHFVEDDELDVSDEISAFVEHTAQNLSRHDQAVGFWIDLDVARQDANRRGAECLLEVAVLLVGQCLDRRGVYRPVERVERLTRAER